MRRLEEVLHDLAEQDERLPTSELIARIERRLPGDSDPSAVVIDGRSDMNSNENPPLAQRRRWAPAAIAVGAALLMAIAVALPIWLLGGGEPIVASPTTLTSSPTSASTSTLPSASGTVWTPTTMPPGEVPPTVAPGEVTPFPPSELSVPLSEAVPGFTDTILVTIWEARSYGVIRWSPSEPMTELLLSPDYNERGDWPVGLDVSTNWSADIRRDGVLSVEVVPMVPGELPQREIVGHDVQYSAVWHNTEPGRLAWLECPNVHEGPATLFTLDVSDPSADQVRVASFEEGCRGSPGTGDPDRRMVGLESWTDSGVWLGMFDRSYSRIDSILIAADGTKTSYGRGGPIDSRSPSPDGTTIWNEFGKSYLLSSDGQHRSPVPSVSDNRFVSEAWWSPDGTRLALHLASFGGREETFRVVDSVSGEILIQREPDRSWMTDPSVAWSTDNRFVLFLSMSGSSPLVFHDTATDTTTRVPLTDNVWQIRIP